MQNRKQIYSWDDPKKCKILQKRFGDYDEFRKNMSSRKEKIQILDIMNCFLDKHNGELKLLDVGCGPGHFLWTLRDKVSKLVGLDYSSHMIELAKEQMSKTDVRSEFFIGSCWDIPLDDNCVDISLQVDVCMHIGGSWDAIQEMIRVSKKYVVFTGPSFEKFDNQIDRFIRNKSWAVSIPLLSRGLNKLIVEGKIIRYEYEHRSRTETYDHRILVIEK